MTGIAAKKKYEIKRRIGRKVESSLKGENRNKFLGVTG